jgi:hypothetical protein
MKIRIIFNSRRNYVLGKFDKYRISEKITLIDIWRFSIFFIKG